MVRRIVASLGCLVALSASAQTPAEIRAAVARYRASHDADIVRAFAELLAIPNVASDTPNIRRNAEYLSAMLRARGATVRLLGEEGTPPAVFGELRVPGARRTIGFYAHYDGQPVDASKWASDPWKPVLRSGASSFSLADLKSPVDPEMRIYARSASDDKAPIQALMSAIDALRIGKIPLRTNVKFLFEGEEEAGSPNFLATIEKHRQLLDVDAWIFCDGPVHQSGRMQAYFGVRGVTDLEMTVYGPNRALHSGHYGNWAPNPAVMLANLLAAMRDDDGNIKIPGFYDAVRPVTEAERAATEKLPAVETALRTELALGRSEGPHIGEAILRPALNVRGVSSGNVGDGAANAIPTEARASIDFRIVPDQTPAQVRRDVERFLVANGYHVVTETPDRELRLKHPKIVKVAWGTGYPPARTSMDLPASKAILAAVEQTLGGPVIKVPTLGGSVPLYLFTDVLQTPVIGLAIVNYDNNQHGANENLRIQNLWDGIDVFAGVLATLDQNWK